MSSIKDKILTAALLPSLVGAGIQPVRADIPRTPFRPNLQQRVGEESLITIPPGPIQQTAQAEGRRVAEIMTEGKNPQDAELIRERIREDVNMFKELENQGPNAGAYMLKEWETGSHAPIAILDDNKKQILLVIGMMNNGQLMVRGIGEDDGALKPIQMEGTMKEICATMAERTQNSVNYLNNLIPLQTAK